MVSTFILRSLHSIFKAPTTAILFNMGISGSMASTLVSEPWVKYVWSLGALDIDSNSPPPSSACYLLVIAIVGCLMCRGGGSTSMSAGGVELPGTYLEYFKGSPSFFGD